MSSITTNLMVSANVCSVTDNDGTTILDISRDRMYSVIGVGSLVWDRLASCQCGVTAEVVFEELSALFEGVPREQIQLDVERILSSFQQKGLVKSRETTSPSFAETIRDTCRTGIALLSRTTIRLLLMLRLNALAALFGLAALNLTLKTLGFRGLCEAVRLWPVRARTPQAEAQQEICDAVDTATTWYPKQAKCLQRSAATTCLLREQGIPANMVIGCRKIPFKAHSWVELNGQVVNDKKQVAEFYRVLNRL